MKNFLGIDRTSPASCVLEELSSLVKDIRAKTREASQNTNLDIQKFVGIDKALQSIQGELQ